MSKDKREELASLEHDQWAHWTRYMLEVLQPLVCLGHASMLEAEAYGFVDSEAIKAVEAIKRWHRQINTPYADLTEKEKDSDREWADKVLAELGRETV